MNKIARSNRGKHVPSVQLAHDRVWQPRCGSNGHAFNRLGLAMNPPLKGEYWVPGGRLYKNERILDAVHRKMREEVGIGVDVVTILGILEFFDPASEYSECGVHTISIVHLVKPLSYDIKLDDQATDWVGSKSCRKN